MQVKFCICEGSYSTSIIIIMMHTFLYFCKFVTSNYAGLNQFHNVVKNFTGSNEFTQKLQQNIKKTQSCNGVLSFFGSCVFCHFVISEH